MGFFFALLLVSACLGADRVLIVLFDQMAPEYADAFTMPNFRALRNAGVSFKDATLGYMCSETVVSHNVVVSGRWPKRQGWVDAVLRDEANALGKGAGAVHLTGDLSFGDFGKLISYPKLADLVHAKFGADQKFIVVGQKAYAVESAAAPSADIAVRMSARSAADPADACQQTLGGRYRSPAGVNVPTYLTQPCGRWFVNCESDLGTGAAFPSWLYPSDGGHFSPGFDAAHLGGDTWVADAALAMLDNEKWRGMFVTMGGIDKAAHQWGANFDVATPVNCSTPDGQTHLRCAAENADVQLGRLVAKINELDARDKQQTLIVLTADHGGSVARNFYGKSGANDGFTNWIWAPDGAYSAGTLVTNLNAPSPALAPLAALKNVKISYQSTAIQLLLADRSPAKVSAAANVVYWLPGVIAVYTLEPGGASYKLAASNRTAMTASEYDWWLAHAQAIVDGMATASAPDVVGLLKDDTSYGVFGDHGGHQERVQRVPVVFWHKDIKAQVRGEQFRHIDLMPTIAAALNLTVTDKPDGRALSLAPVTPAPSVTPTEEPSMTGTILLIVGGLYCFFAALTVAIIKLKNRIKKAVAKRRVTRV